MSAERKNIKLQPDDFERLKADKPESVDWAYYLLEMRTLD